jgi:hypothetical protein
VVAGAGVGGSAVVVLAADLTVWMQMLAFTEHEAGRWGPKKLHDRIFTIPRPWTAPDGGSGCTCRPDRPGPA